MSKYTLVKMIWKTTEWNTSHIFYSSALAKSQELNYNYL